MRGLPRGRRPNQTSRSQPKDLTPTLGPLLTHREVAEFLAVSPTTVWRLVRSGELPAYRVGGQLRLSAVAVENYVKSHPTRQEANT